MLLFSILIDILFNCLLICNSLFVLIFGYKDLIVLECGMFR